MEKILNEDCQLLGCNVMYHGRKLLIFQRNTVCFSKNVNLYQTIQYQVLKTVIFIPTSVRT